MSQAFIRRVSVFRSFPLLLWKTTRFFLLLDVSSALTICTISSFLHPWSLDSENLSLVFPFRKSATPHVAGLKALKPFIRRVSVFLYYRSIWKNGFHRTSFPSAKNWDERTVCRQVPLDLRAYRRPRLNLVSKCQKLRRKNCLPTGASWLTSLSQASFKPRFQVKKIETGCTSLASSNIIVKLSPSQIGKKEL